MTWPYSAYNGRELAARGRPLRRAARRRGDAPPAALRGLPPVRRDARRGQPARLDGQGLARARRPRRAGGRGALSPPRATIALRHPAARHPGTPADALRVGGRSDRRDRLPGRRRPDGRVRRRPRAADRRRRREPDRLRRAPRRRRAAGQLLRGRRQSLGPQGARADSADPPEAGRPPARGHHERRQQHPGRPGRPRGDQGHRRGGAGAVGGRDRLPSARRLGGRGREDTGCLRHRLQRSHRVSGRGSQARGLNGRAEGWARCRS